MNKPSITIHHLCEQPQALPQLVELFEATWPEWYGPDGQGDAEADLRAAASRDEIPLCLVAINESGEALGSIAIRKESIPSHRHLSPWLVGLVVREDHRGRGIARALIAHMIEEARRIGIAKLYTSTNDLSEGLIRGGAWQQIDTAEPGGKPVKVWEIGL